MNGFTQWCFGEEKSGAAMPVPVVYVEDKTTFEFKQIVHDLDANPDEPDMDELTALGAEGWHIAGVATVSSRLIIYMQRLVRA